MKRRVEGGRKEGIMKRRVGGGKQEGRNTEVEGVKTGVGGKNKKRGCMFPVHG